MDVAAEGAERFGDEDEGKEDDFEWEGELDGGFVGLFVFFG